MSTSKSEGAMISCNGLVRDTVDHVNVILSPTWIGSLRDLMSTWLSSSMRPTDEIYQKLLKVFTYVNKMMILFHI